MKRLAALALPALAACGADEAAVAETDENPCEQVVFESSRFTHCTVDPAKVQVALRLSDQNGQPLRTFDRLAQEIEEPSLILAMNAGMSDEDGQPIGLYVEDSNEFAALNRNEGAGNFHLLPNGVFWGGQHSWHVDTTDAYAARDGGDLPTYATQSGPMLVIDGELHPDFAEDGDSRHFRNGVGVDKGGQVHFAISDDLVSFGKFARFFRDAAKTPNALYLDGAVSRLWAPDLGRRDSGPPLGPLIVVRKYPKADE